MRDRGDREGRRDAIANTVRSCLTDKRGRKGEAERESGCERNTSPQQQRRRRASLAPDQRRSVQVRSGGAEQAPRTRPTPEVAWATSRHEHGSRSGIIPIAAGTKNDPARSPPPEGCRTASRSYQAAPQQQHRNLHEERENVSCGPPRGVAQGRGLSKLALWDITLALETMRTTPPSRPLGPGLMLPVAADLAVREAAKRQAERPQPCRG